MGFACGIVGLPNVGKSTLFNSLSSARAESANYPFCTIEPNVGIVPVPDKRIDALSAIVNPDKIQPATIRFVDIAGLVKGASKGEGLGNQFLAHIREVDAIAHVVRCFDDENVIHVDNKIDPLSDIATIHTELGLRDLDTVQKRAERARKMAKANSAVEKAALTTCEALAKHLDEGKPARSFAIPDDNYSTEIIRELFLLTGKPTFYVANVDEASLGALDKNRHYQAVLAHAASEGARVVPICAALEAQITELEPAERPEFLASVGLEEPGLNSVIRAGYELLGLSTYFTAGKVEVRAWTIRKGWTAPQAAGVIHTDFEKGFIKAEVIWWEDFVKLGGEARCREAGKLAIEGKEYVVRDGDVMHFRFNVLGRLFRVDLRERVVDRHPWETARYELFAGLLATSRRLGDQRVLDVGAGDAYFATRLAAESRPDEVCCVDAAYTEADRARLAAAHPGVRFSSSPPADRFDVVLLLDVLEHVVDDSGFLGAIVSDHLASRGLVVVSVPAWPSLWTSHDIALGHHRRYTPQTFATLLASAGLRVLQRGQAFATLPLARGLGVARERLGRRRPHASTSTAAPASTWQAPRLVTEAIYAFLSLDLAMSRFARDRGVELPGLSLWALCEACAPPR